MSKKLVRSSMLVSTMTLLSRVLGLVRDMVIANLVGAGAVADVFLFANRIPNFLRRIFAEGAFSQAFVPVLAEHQKDGQLSETQQFISKASGTLGGVVAIVTIIAMCISPIIVAIFGAGWFIEWWQGGPDADKYVQASLLLRITFPYLWFISIVALSGAVLNSIGKFGVMSFSPVLLNVAMIGAALYLSPYCSSPDIALAIGIFLGGLLQFLFQLPFLKQAGFLVKPKWAWNDPGIKKVRTLMIPALFGVSVSQINLLLNTCVASFLVTGSISWLYYSDRLLEFPLGLFGVTIAVVILPSLARYHVDNPDAVLNAKFKQTMDWGIRMVMFLGVPSMIGIAILVKPILLILFMRGNFLLQDVEATALSLLTLNCGMLCYMSIKILANGYYARQDIKTPVRYGVISMVSCMLFNLLAIPFGYVGLAMASALAAGVNAGLLYRGLVKRNIYQITAKSWYFLLKLLIAGTAMAIALIYFNPLFNAWLEMDTGARVIRLVSLIGLALFVYIMVLLAVGVRTRDFRAD